MDIFIISVKKCVWAKYRRYLGAHLWPVDKILGPTVVNAWRIVGSTNGGATNVLFFCVGICSDDGGGNGRGAMQKID